MTRGSLLLLVFLLDLLATPGRAERIRLEVSADGSADFVSIQQAIDYVPPNLSDWAVIHVHSGTYVEALQIPVDKRNVILVGDGRDATVLECDESFHDSLGRLVAVPVLTNRASDVVVRSLSIRNLAAEPGGSGGKWDAALMNFGDRVILDDVLLRGDHDTLLMYGPAYNGGPGHGHVYVRDSHLQGRGDFIAAFNSAFIEDSVLETIRDRGHFLFHRGLANHGPAGKDALVVRNSTFTGQSLDPVWPFGVSNLYEYARLYLLGNRFEYDIGANRPVAFFHDGFQPFTSEVRHFGNTQALSPQGPLIWDLYSIPGSGGNPRQDLPMALNVHGQPIVAALTAAEAAAITPAWLFEDWNPTATEPRSDCENGLDDDGDGAVDLADPDCASSADFSESAAPACDDGLDDDGDGRVDFAGGDPGCTSAADPSELSGVLACDNGLDDDGDGRVDFAGGDPGCTSVTDPSEFSQVLGCDNGLDDDGDGRVDFVGGDPGCASITDPSEHSDALPCDNGVDDDGDGWADFGGGDPGCRDPKGAAENPQCQDGVDNDGQLGVDFDGGASRNGGVPFASADPECTSAWLNREAAAAPPPGCGIGAELVLLLPLLARLRRARDPKDEPSR